MTKRRVLVVDDEPKMQRVLEIMLKGMGHEALLAADGPAALAVTQTIPVDLVVTDLRMPGMDGVALLSALREQGNTAPVIIMTAHGSVESAVTAMKQGAYDYILRPFDIDAVEVVITRALALEQVQRENQFLREEVERGWENFVGRSPAMQQVYELIRSVAPSQASVLITGESGTGKELAAHAIHRASPRCNALFVPINCAAIPAEILESELFGHTKGAFTGAHRDRIGKFAMADGGTIFLDEITEMQPALQAKLLRVLQDNVIERLGSDRGQPVDIRVIAATNQDVSRVIKAGTFREDLYYRLNVFPLEMPPLRQRVEDIPALAEHFLEKHGRKLGYVHLTITPDALARLQGYPWPGNVRELSNVIERAVVLSRGAVIEPRHLPRELAAVPEPISAPSEAGGARPLALVPAVEQCERELIAQALQQADGNKAKAARLLDVSERTLWYKARKYGLV